MTNETEMSCEQRQAIFMKLTKRELAGMLVGLHDMQPTLPKWAEQIVEGRAQTIREGVGDIEAALTHLDAYSAGELLEQMLALSRTATINRKWAPGDVTWVDDPTKVYAPKF